MADDLDYLDSLLDAPFAKTTSTAASNVSVTEGNRIGRYDADKFVLINSF